MPRPSPFPKERRYFSSLAIGSKCLRLPILSEAVGAEGILLRTFGEDLELRDFYWGLEDKDLYKDVYNNRGDNFTSKSGDMFITGQSIDVAGEWFGLVAISQKKEGTDQTRELINTWSEELDNFLATIAQARTKHRVTSEIADSLTQRVLDEGINDALKLMKNYVNFDDLILIYFNEQSQHADFHYKIILDGVMKYDSYSSPDQKVEDYLRSHFDEGVSLNSKDLADYFNLSHHVEEKMICGVHKQEQVGRVVVGRKEKEFNTFDRDLLDIFTTYLRQRVVDFNREWEQLTHSFCPTTAQRLMSEDGYMEKHLHPREYPVAIMYTDISGFTKISEQKLQKPELIGRLVNVWSQHVVNMIWETGGVFDKLVGDCIIGLWGPPFNEYSKEEACERALKASIWIRDFTASMADGKLIEELKDLEIGVSTGVNYCPLFVGIFGPNEAFTGFSSGMNNAARLQGLADFQQILCMDNVVEIMKDKNSFGEKESASVKNVAEPLNFCELK